MQLIKFFSIIVSALLVILTIAFITLYSARISVINTLIKTQANLSSININCLDINLASDLSIRINKACLKTPQADIEIVGMTIQWQALSKVNITNIDINLLNIKATAPLFTDTKFLHQSKNQQSKSELSISQLLVVKLREYADKISQFQLPTNINITELYYLPFSVKNKEKLAKRTMTQHPNHLYTAQLSLIHNCFYFSLRNAKKIEFIKAKLSKNKANFTLSVVSKLKPLQSFASAHQLPISAELQNILDITTISASINTLMTYQAGALNIKNNITNIAINVMHGIGKSGAFKLNGNINFQSQFNFTTQKLTNKTVNRTSDKNDKSNEEIALTFSGKNEMALTYRSSQLITMLKQNKLSPTIISLLKDNPLEHITLTLPNNTTLLLNPKKITLSHITINADSDERPHQLTLNKIMVTLPKRNDPATNKKIILPTFSIARFNIDSQLNVAGLNNITSKPIVMHLFGSFQQSAQQFNLNLSKKSSISAHNISISKTNTQSKENTINADKLKNRISIKNLTTILHGNIQQLKGQSFTLNLNVNSYASQLNIPQVLSLKSFDIISKIKGDLSNIHLNASTYADGVELGKLKIAGAALSPQIEISATQLSLTELLSLNIKLPTKIALIDGALTYRISGKLNDLRKIENTAFTTSIAITSLSGEVANIGLQKLNWQQNFTLLAGKISSQTNNTENLTIDLIDSSIPIAKLAMSTRLIFDKNVKLYVSKLKGNLLGGSFYIPKIQWPLKQRTSVDVQLNAIDLAQVLALEKKQGIVVTGKISGQVPIIFDGKNYMIKEGELHNISDGLIQVMNSPAVADFRVNNSQLQLAFEALQNLHYHQLSSTVSMQNDGYMLLKTVIKGYNPDIDDDVNLNLNLNYDLLGLLKSLSIAEHFENNLVKDLQKIEE